VLRRLVNNAEESCFASSGSSASSLKTSTAISRVGEELVELMLIIPFLPDFCNNSVDLMMGESDGGSRHPSFSLDPSDPRGVCITAPGGGDTQLTTFGDADRCGGADRCARLRLCVITSGVCTHTIYTCVCVCVCVCVCRLTSQVSQAQQ
jgi:hypothetical protein